MGNKSISLSSCKKGLCPVCGTKVTHTETEQCETSTQLYWECPECHCTGEENYEHIFSGHINVFDKDGNEMAADRPETAPEQANAWKKLLALLPTTPDDRIGFWTNGDEILCRHEYQAHAIADFLEAIGIGDNTTGTYEHIEGEPIRPEDGWAYIC